MPDTLKPTVASSKENFMLELQKYYQNPSIERENFIYNSILKYVTKGDITSNMKAITANGVGGITGTFKVMTDYIKIGDYRVPMSGNNAKKVAAYYDLKMPDAEIAKLIYQYADVKVAAKPLSYTGVQVGNTRYSGKDVTQGVGRADFVSEYNKRINEDLKQKAKPGQIVSGFAKDIVDLPGQRSKTHLGLYGFYDEKGVVIGSASSTGGTDHTQMDTHSEYGAFLRLVDKEAEITAPELLAFTLAPTTTGIVSAISPGAISSSTAPTKIKIPIEKLNSVLTRGVSALGNVPAVKKANIKIHDFLISKAVYNLNDSYKIVKNFFNRRK